MTALEKLEARLKELPAEQLAQLLITSSKGNPKLRKELLALTAETKDLVSSAKRAITSLRKLDGSHHRLSSGSVANKVHDVVVLITRIAERSADDAFALCCSLLTTEAHLHGQVDDSSGFITSIFRGPLLTRAGALVLRCRDEKGLLASLLTACQHDEFGTVQDFIDVVAPSLPDAIARKVMANIAGREPQKQSDSSFHYDSNVEMLKRFHVALGEIEEFIRLGTSTTGLHVSDHITIAGMYCDYDEFEKAEEWLAKVSTDNHAVAKQRQQMLVRILTGLGRADELRTIYRVAFLEAPSQETFETFGDYCGQEAAAALEQEFLQAVRSDQNPRMESISFLVRRGFASEMTDVLFSMKRPDVFNYYILGAIANEFISQKSWLGATIAYRMLIEDILAHAKTGAYPIAATYVRQLQSLARVIKAWGSVAPHTVFMSTLFEKHGRKTSFWDSAQRYL